MDRYWFLTWTTYGSWLPGDDRGFVCNIDRGDGKEVRFNQLGTEPASKMRDLTLMAQENMKGDTVLLDAEDAFALANQFHETASYCNWELQAFAIMCSHIHVVVGVPGDPDPAALLQSFKSYASRKLNEHRVKPSSGTWWTESGSHRKLPDRNAVAGAVAYVRDQESPLWIGIHPLCATELGPRFPRNP